MNLAKLRKDLPDWEWRAERSGYGWCYVGTKAFAEVFVRAYSIVSGPGDDDYETQWRAEQGSHTESYASFWLRHAV